MKEHELNNTVIQISASSSDTLCSGKQTPKLACAQSPSPACRFTPPLCDRKVIIIHTHFRTESFTGKLLDKRTRAEGLHVYQRLLDSSRFILKPFDLRWLKSEGERCNPVKTTRRKLEASEIKCQDYGQRRRNKTK